MTRPSAEAATEHNSSRSACHLGCLNEPSKEARFTPDTFGGKYCTGRSQRQRSRLFHRASGESERLVPNPNGYLSHGRSHEGRQRRRPTLRPPPRHPLSLNNQNLHGHMTTRYHSVPDAIPSSGFCDCHSIQYNTLFTSALFPPRYFARPSLSYIGAVMPTSYLWVQSSNVN